MKNFLFLFLIIISHQIYSIEEDHFFSNYIPQKTTDWLIFATGMGITSGIAYYTLKQFFTQYFSAQSYYNSAKKIRDTARLDGIEHVKSFEQIIAVIKENQVYRWRQLVYSDCYVVDIYHFIQKQLQQLSIAQEYLITARTKKDFDSPVLYVVEQLEFSINHLHNIYIHLRTICEIHPLFSQHMAIYHQRECAAREQE